MKSVREVETMKFISVEYLAVCVVAVIMHEMAHVLVARAMGIRIKRAGISWRGPYIVREQGLPLANLCTALAGPALNLLLGVALWRFAPQFSLVNLLLGTYNLLPFIPGLDGYNALAAYRKLAAVRQTVSSVSRLSTRAPQL
jgi:Zn-dependent protease